MATEQFLYENFAASKLAASISDTDTELVVEAGDGGLFPEPVVGDEAFTLVLVKLVSGEYVYEIVHATERIGDTITIRRAEEGTTAKSFTTGDLVELRITKDSVLRFQNAVPIQTSQIEDDAVTDAKIDWSTVSSSVGANQLSSDERMTTSNVRVATAGSLRGQLGTYALMRLKNFESVSGGGTISGSNLYFSDFSNDAEGPASGTWRCMGAGMGYDSRDRNIFLRVS